MYIFHLRFSGFWFAAVLALTCNLALAAEKTTGSPAPKPGGIVKWVDEKGVTHYGDSLPPQYAGRDSTELNRGGRVVKQNNPAATQANKAVVEGVKLSTEQKRHDSALLAAYTTEQEFDLARDRNLQTDEAAVDGLNQRMASVKERLAANKKTADGFGQRKKPVPDYLAQDMKSKQDEIAKVEAQIAERQKSMEETRQRFEKDKQRFIQLKLNPNAPLPVETAPVAAPVAGAAPEAASATPAVITPPKPVASTAPMAAPKAPTAKLAPTAPATPPSPAPEKPAAAPAPPLTAAPVAATPAQPAAPSTTKPISPAEKTVGTTPAATTPATPAPAPAPTATAASKPATTAATKPAKKIKRVVMP